MERPSRRAVLQGSSRGELQLVGVKAPTNSRLIEAAAAVLIFVTVFGLFFSYKLIRTDEMRGDSAMYLQGTENLAARGKPVSQVQGSIIDFLNENTYTSTPAAEIAKNPAPLFGTPAAHPESSIMLGHAYFILYPVALFVKVLPVRPVLLFLYVFSFTAMILLAYFAMRGRGLTVAAALLFCLLCATHPVWWQGLLWGQFYPDRLFMIAGFAFMLLAAGDIGANLDLRRYRIWLLVAAALCASINERGAIVSGLFAAMYAVLYWKKPGADRYLKLALGAVLLFYGLFALKVLVPTDTSYGTFLPTTLGGVIATMQAPRFAPMVTLFALVNAPLLILALFEWRAALIAFVLMLPNVFGNIGGAEKLGWATHYPTFFFPSLVWAALSGYRVLFRLAAERKLVPAAYAVPAVLMLFLWMLSPAVFGPPSLSVSNVQQSALPTFADQFQTYVFDAGARATLKGAVDGITAAVPEGAVVSSVEAGMPLLFHGRTIQFFPKDIDHADYAVLGASVENGTISYNGVVNSLGAAELQQWNDLVVARMKRDGYDLEHPVLFPAYAGIAIVRRIHR